VKAFAALLSALLSALPAARVTAATAYVSDELVLGVYAEQNNQGQRLTTLHSGASVDTLSVNGEFTEVRLNDGTTGWVKSTFLTPREPATVRVKQLEEELDRSRATTPALAEAAARSELLQLQRELAAKQGELDDARQAMAAAAVAPEPVTASMGNGVAAQTGVMSAISGAAPARPWLGALSILFALAFGFWLGYVMLARRVKRKFGGIKVY
jgi:hypothetical protein